MDLIVCVKGLLPSVLLEYPHGFVIAESDVHIGKLHPHLGKLYTQSLSLKFRNHCKVHIPGCRVWLSPNLHLDGNEACMGNDLVIHEDHKWDPIVIEPGAVQPFPVIFEKVPAFRVHALVKII